MHDKIKQLKPFLPKGYAEKVLLALQARGIKATKVNIYSVATGRTNNTDIIEALIACAEEEKKRQADLKRRLDKTLK